MDGFAGILKSGIAQDVDFPRFGINGEIDQVGGNLESNAFRRGQCPRCDWTPCTIQFSGQFLEAKTLLGIGLVQKVPAIDEDIISGNLPYKRSSFGHLGQYVLGRLVDRDARGKSSATSHRLKRVSYRGSVTNTGEDIAGVNS